MSAYLYDEALVDNLRTVTSDGRITIVPPENAVVFIAQISKDKFNLPVILVRRRRVSLAETSNQVARLKGESVRYNAEENTVTKAQSMPIRIEWDIDVYTADRFTCDEIIRELVWYFSTRPRMKVKIPYGLDIEQNFHVLLEPELADNTDLLGFPSTGELFRETMGIYTDNARLFASQRQYLTKVKPDVEDATNDLNNKL